MEACTRRLSLVSRRSPSRHPSRRAVSGRQRLSKRCDGHLGVEYFTEDAEDISRDEFMSHQQKRHSAAQRALLPSRFWQQYGRKGNTQCAVQPMNPPLPEGEALRRLLLVALEIVWATPGQAWKGRRGASTPVPGPAPSPSGSKRLNDG
jgi:hypothetical protein